MSSPEITSQYDKLKNRNKILETIINASEAGVYVSDYHTGEILFANQKTAEFIGGSLSAEELNGKICWKALNKDTDERCTFCAYKKLIGENGELLPPYTWERYFEEYGAWAKITNQAIRWVDGRLAQITTFHNITEMKKMQQMLEIHARNEEQYKMQQNLQNLLDKLPVPVGITDAETTNLVYVNRMFLKIFEYTDENELVGHSVLTIFPQTSNGCTNTKQRVGEILDLKGIHAFEMEFVTASGKSIDARLTTYVLEYNNRASSVGIITDLSAEKEQQRLFIQAAEHERKANQMKSTFISNMSHEMRTPLNAIMGMSTIISKSADNKEKTLASAAKIMASSRHLLSIVNDVLDMAKIESGKFELMYEPFSLKSSFNDVMVIISQHCAEKNIRFVTNTDNVKDYTLVGDKTRVNQVLINLLGNAVKFTEEFGEIHFTIDITEESEKDLLFTYTIRDNGIGMSQEQLSRLFVPFEQGSSLTAIRYGGTGLGLSISHNLVNMMGGKISVKSELGKGSIFYFALKLDRIENIYKETEDKSKNLDLRGKRALLAEDVEINREIVRELLSDTGLIIDEAENGQVALDMFAQSSERYYNVIFMDAQMPFMDGYEATRRIRALERSDAKNIPIVAMTANAYKEDVDRSLSAGMNVHLSKPVEYESIIKTLQEFLV